MLFCFEDTTEAQGLTVTSLNELRNTRFTDQNGRARNAVYVHARVWTG
jgi:hypothetical protein